MKWTRILQVATCICWIAPGCAVAQAAAEQSCASGASLDKPAPLVDHHTHILTPRSTHWAEVQGASLKPRGIEDLLTTMRKDGVDRAAVLSAAYWFGHSTAKTPRSYSNLKLENDNVGRLVANYPKRLVALFGINPLAPTALDEIKRDVRSGLFVGIKMHLTNSDVDLRDPQDIVKLARVFSLADELRVPVVIHMRTRRKDYGYLDAENFIDKVLTKAPHITVQIAHLGGWGGYDVNTDNALRAFVDNKKEIRTKLYFDIAAIVREKKEEVSPRPEAKDGSKTASKEKEDSVALHWPDAHEKQLVADRIRELGLSRIVFGTDWPFGAQASYWHDFGEQIPLKPCELLTIRGNRAPWLRGNGEP